MRAEPSDDGGAPQPLRSAGAAEEPASPYVRGVEGFGASSGKLEHLQGARCVATIFVLYHHDWYFSGGARSFWGRNGLAAVDFFVVLSGFATHWSNPGQQKRAKFPTSKAPIPAIFHSFRLIFGRAIISRSALEAWTLCSRRAGTG